MRVATARRGARRRPLSRSRRRGWSPFWRATPLENRTGGRFIRSARSPGMATDDTELRVQVDPRLLRRGLSRVANRVRVTLAITAGGSSEYLARWRRWRACSPPGSPTQPPPGSHFETRCEVRVDVAARDPDGGEAVARTDRVEDRSDARGAALQRDRQDRPGTTAASTLPPLSGPTICGNGISTKRTSPGRPRSA